MRHNSLGALLITGETGDEGLTQIELVSLHSFSRFSSVSRPFVSCCSRLRYHLSHGFSFVSRSTEQGKNGPPTLDGVALTL